MELTKMYTVSEEASLFKLNTEKEKKSSSAKLFNTNVVHKLVLRAYSYRSGQAL
jgi:hypothetical protein